MGCCIRDADDANVTLVSKTRALANALEDSCSSDAVTLNAFHGIAHRIRRLLTSLAAFSLAAGAQRRTEAEPLSTVSMDRGSAPPKQDAPPLFEALQPLKPRRAPLACARGRALALTEGGAARRLSSEALLPAPSPTAGAGGAPA